MVCENSNNPFNSVHSRPLAPPDNDEINASRSRVRASLVAIIQQSIDRHAINARLKQADSDENIAHEIVVSVPLVSWK